MRRELIETGRTVQQKLRASEQSVDEGLVAMMEVTSALLTARMQMGVAAQFGRDLITEHGQVLRHQLDQRDRLLNMHDRLAALATEVGLPLTMLGDEGEKVKFKPAGLTVVPAVAA